MIKINNLNINSELILAPMAGYTDSPFRRICRRFGSGMVFTELISADGIIRANRKTLDLMRFNDDERPIGIQIFGNDPDIMSQAAVILQDLKPDLIDINAGCSARRIVGSGSGAALLGDPEKLEAIAGKIVKNVTIPVSAKIRIGLDDKNKNYAETVRILEGSGISMLSVHGRTRAQAFKGDSDWNIIHEIKSISGIPVIGNGDITTYQEARMRLETSGCDAVMIGRGAVGNPWIFSGRIPDKNELAEQIKLHLDMMINYYGENGIILMRKHVVKYIRNLRDSAKLRASLVNAKSKEEMMYYIDSIKK